MCDCARVLTTAKIPCPCRPTWSDYVWKEAVIAFDLIRSLKRPDDITTASLKLWQATEWATASKQRKGAHPSTQSHMFFFCTWWLWVVLSSDICQRGWKQNVETSQVHVNYRSITIIVVKMGATFKKKLKCALLIFFTFGKHHVKWNRSLQWLPLLKTCVLKQNEQSAHSKKYCSNLVHANLDIKYLTLTRHHFPQVHEICM